MSIGIASDELILVEGLWVLVREQQVVVGVLAHGESYLVSVLVRKIKGVA
jgi:hypothetical protein